MENKVVYQIYRDEYPDEYYEGDNCILFKTVETKEDADKIVDMCNKITIYDPSIGSNFLVQKYTVESSKEVNDLVETYLNKKYLCVKATIYDYIEYQPKKFGEGIKFKLAVSRRLLGEDDPIYKECQISKVDDCSWFERRTKWTVIHVNFVLDIETIPNDSNEILKMIANIADDLTNHKYDIRYVYDEFKPDSGIKL